MAVQQGSETWDAIVVGAGHNVWPFQGLACAAYIARGHHCGKAVGKTQKNRTKLKVLVLERSGRVGGACTSQKWTTPAGDLTISPCAYVCGLLHPIVIEELDLVKRGFEWREAEAGLFIPFPDGTSVLLHNDTRRAVAEIAKIAPEDGDGYRKMHALCAKAVAVLRPPGKTGDSWLNPPNRAEVVKRLRRVSDDAVKLVFEWSMAEFLDHFLKSEKLKTALLGQGVIGTNASPFERGTAYIYFHHLCGSMQGKSGAWGYVLGGMGRISELLRAAAEEEGVVVRLDSPVAKIVPGVGVVLQNGQSIYSSVVVSNADPRTTLQLLGDAAPAPWRRQVLAIPMVGVSMKVNIAMTELPNFKVRPGLDQEHHRAQINFPLTRQEWQEGFTAMRRGQLPAKFWLEMYLHTAVDRSIASTPNLHHVSIFAQYCPYRLAQGTWKAAKEQIKQTVMQQLAAACSNVPSAVVAIDVMSPADIEREIGISGGHIFHGDCLPEYMWDSRLSNRVPVDSGLVYLCGSGTHPGGSVIGANGRLAAMRVLTDLKGPHNHYRDKPAKPKL